MTTKHKIVMKMPVDDVKNKKYGITNRALYLLATTKQKYGGYDVITPEVNNAAGELFRNNFVKVVKQSGRHIKFEITEKGKKVKEAYLKETEKR